MASRIARNFPANRSYVYDDDGAVRGFAYIETGPRISQIILYTDPAHRGRGIGSILWDLALETVRAIDPNTVWVFFRRDVGRSGEFYRNRGCLPWYAYHHMLYQPTGPARPQPVLRARRHEAADFDEYLRERNRALIDPAARRGDACPPADRQTERILRWTRADDVELYLFHDAAGAFVGSVAIEEGYFVDNLFVCPERQGRGYGRSIVRFVTGRILESGRTPELAVDVLNEAAVGLYRGTGFRVFQTLEMNRLFSPNKPPDLSSP